MERSPAGNSVQIEIAIAGVLLARLLPFELYAIA